MQAEQAKPTMCDGYEPLLEHSRWCSLERPSNPTTKQSDKPSDLLQCNQKPVRADLLEKDLELLRAYVLPVAAGRFLEGCRTQVLRSRIETMKKMARTIRAATS